MKKIEYIVPEIEVLELKYSPILCASGDEPPYGGPGDDETDPD